MGTGSMSRQIMEYRNIAKEPELISSGSSVINSELFSLVAEKLADLVAIETGFFKIY